MNHLSLAFFCLLICSILFNFFFFIKWKKSKKAKVESYEAKQLLHDLIRGGAIVRITPIDPENLILRSPRSSL